MMRVRHRAHPDAEATEVVVNFSYRPGAGVGVVVTKPPTEPLAPLDEYTQKVRRSRARGTVYPYEIVPMLTGTGGTFAEHDLDDAGRLVPVDRPRGHNPSGIVAGVVSTPRPVTDPIRQLEFLKLRENRVLVVFVSEAGLVTNKVLALDFTLEPGELERAANYLNEKLRHGPVEGLRERILAEMREDRSALHALVEQALLLAERALGPGEGGEVLVDGEESFLDAPEFADVHKARLLLKAFAEKDRILRVLDRVLRAREVRIFIGAESEFAAVPDVSVVAAPYGRGDQVLGTLAVIGPTRMNYARVIPLVDLTAREISRALGAEDG